MEKSPMLKIGLEVPDTDAEGPGRRYAIWVQGCVFRCPGCCNPELWEFDGGDPEIESADAILSRIRDAIIMHDIKGVSFLGGEPFMHAEGLSYIAKRCQEIGLDVMVYSGFTLGQIKAANKPDWNALLHHTDILVDGKYVETKPDHTRRWIGSTNQEMHCLSDKYDANDPLFFEKNSIEIRFSPTNGLVINGEPWGEGMI